MHPPEPPRAQARPTVLRHGDDERIDPWYWLRSRDDPAVLAYLRDENAYTAAVLAHEAPLRERLFAEIVGRVQETDASAPVPFGDYEYFTRTVEGLQYPIHCRRPRGAAPLLPDPVAVAGTVAGESIVLDENEWAAGHEFFEVGDLVVSPDQRLVAFSTDTTGGERFRLGFAETATGRVLEDVVDDVYYGVAWSNDNTTVLYTRPDEIMRPWQVWRHSLGSPTADDVLVFQEDDDRFFVGLERMRSGHWLAITTASKLTSEVWLVDADDPAAPARVVAPREHGHEYHVEHHVGPGGDRLFVVSNSGGATDFRLMVTPTSAPVRSSWVEVIPGRPGTRLEDVDAFRGHLVVSERADAHTRLRVFRFGDDGTFVDERPVTTPDDVGSVWTGDNPEYDTARLRFGFTSLVEPTTAYDHDMDTGASTLVKQQTVPGYDAARYASRREWATASDGTKVPISLVWRRDRATDAPGPLLLYGYGSYEISIDPAFSVSRVSLLNRGVAFAIAHVRGGGELGRAWYEDGKLLHKRNTFTDFVSCAEHLVAAGWTHPALLAARGGSAGGLLMGATANLAPDLFRVIVAEVPFVDCLTTILDEELPLTVTEWEEWGDPVHDEAVYELMRSYSPYDNVSARDYPALLVTGGLNDPRVQYWEPAKWTAKLRATKTDDRRLVLKMEMGAGHSGPSGRYDAWRDEAFVLAFVLDELGLAAT